MTWGLTLTGFKFCKSSAPQTSPYSNQNKHACEKTISESPQRCRAFPHFLSLTEQSTAMMFCISFILTSSCGISTAIGIFSSSRIFSAEELRLDSLSSSSSISKMRSATQWAVRRASGSWSQHSLIVAQITATPWRGFRRDWIWRSRHSLDLPEFLKDKSICSY